MVQKARTVLVNCSISRPLSTAKAVEIFALFVVSVGDDGEHRSREGVHALVHLLRGTIKSINIDSMAALCQ